MTNKTNRKRAARASVKAYPNMSYQQALQLVDIIWGTLPNTEDIIPTDPKVEETNVFEPFPINKGAWNEFPIGTALRGNIVYWDVDRNPVMWVTGVPGRGKTFFQKGLLTHALRHPNWRVTIFDRKEFGGEYLDYSQNPQVNLETDFGKMGEIIAQVEREMQVRYSEMKKQNVNHFTFLEHSPEPMLLIVDEIYDLVAKRELDGDGVCQTVFNDHLLSKINNIALLGRAAGVYLSLATVWEHLFDKSSCTVTTNWRRGETVFTVGTTVTLVNPFRIPPKF